MPATATQPKPKTRRKRRWTEVDLLSLPDDGRKYELVKSNLEVQVLNEDDILKGEPILPGFEVRVGDLFTE